MVGVFAFYPTAAVAEKTDFGRERRRCEAEARECSEREKKYLVANL
jgi:hypothetical protein